jgi:hypothetical protein
LPVGFQEIVLILVIGVFFIAIIAIGKRIKRG